MTTSRRDRDENGTQVTVWRKEYDRHSDRHENESWAIDIVGAFAELP